MVRPSLTEALGRAEAYKNLGRPIPPTARMRWLQQVELAVVFPFLRRQMRYNAAVVDALEQLRHGVETGNANTGQRVAYTQHHEGIAALRRDMVAVQQQFLEVSRQLERVQAAQRAAEARIDVFLAEVRRALPVPPSVAALAGQPRAWDRLYGAFENVYRGSVQEISDRLSVYLADLPSAPELAALPVVDLGCGRGEWLELLRGAGVPAYGVEVNGQVAAAAGAGGLDVRSGDLVEHLRGVPERSLAAVTAFHLLEHLDLDEMIEVLDLSLRALAPGGRLIVETPNPENVAVGANSFYLDPTHRRPLPPALLSFLVDARGYGDVQVRRLARTAPPLPVPPEPGPLADVVGLLNRHFGEAADYAVLATRL